MMSSNLSSALVLPAPALPSLTDPPSLPFLSSHPPPTRPPTQTSSTTSSNPSSPPT